MQSYSVVINRFLRLYLLPLICLLQASFATAKTIAIKTQEQFDAAVERINNGEELCITLKKGTFILNGKIQANKPLSISGNKATILACSGSFSFQDIVKEQEGFNVFRITNDITPYALFFDSSGRILNVSESVNGALKVNHAEGGILAGKEMNAGTTIRIPIPEYLKHLSNRQFSNAFGYFDCGWQTVNFILEQSDDSFFYCKTVNLCRTGNYSYDKKANKDFVRYVIYNAEKKQNAIYYDNEYLYVPVSVNSFYYLNCKSYTNSLGNIIARSDFSIKGVRLIGVSIDVNSEASSKCELTGCTFLNNIGCALRVTRTGDVAIQQAKIKNCHFQQVSLFIDYAISFSCPNVGGNYASMSECEVVRYPAGAVAFKNPNGAVGVKGNVTLTNNVIWNTPRCHLYFNGGIIVAKGNVLFNTDVFNSSDERNLSSDFGLIYCNHVFSSTEKAIANNSNSILLENNLLYGAFAYNGDARGVFIDNGRGDVTCKDNVILHCQLYSMDSRNSMQDASSIRNRYEGNVVTTSYRLIAGSAVSGLNTPSTRSNILATMQQNIVSNINVVAEDVRINDLDITTMYKEGSILVSNDLYNLIRKSKAWKSVKKYVKINE